MNTGAAALEREMVYTLPITVLFPLGAKLAGIVAKRLAFPEEFPSGKLLTVYTPVLLFIETSTPVSEETEKEQLVVTSVPPTNTLNVPPAEPKFTFPIKSEPTL